MYRLLTILILLSTSISFGQIEQVEAQIFNPNNSVFSPKTYAIVIGISNYENLNDSKQLEWADDDALMMVDYLSTQENVELYLYTNENATDQMAIGRKIHEILTKKAESIDKLIIYFSGHGDISTEDNNGYLLLHKVDKPTVTPYSWSDALPIHKIKNTIISSEINKQNVYLIFDACKSGYAQVPNTGTNFIEHQKIVMMLSSQATQVSSEDDELKHGVFTYYLIQGMNGLANVGEGNEISLDELKSYVNTNVSAKTNSEQTPLFSYMMDDVVSVFTDKSLEMASMEVGSNINLAVAGNKKGGDEIINTQTTRCDVLLSMLKEQAAQGNFFQDDIQLTTDRLAIGKKESLFTSDEVISSLTSTSNGKLHGLIQNGNVILSPTLSFKSTMALTENENATHLSFNPNGDKICIVSSDIVELWNGKTGDKLEVSLTNISDITNLKFLSNNIIGITNNKGQFYTWDTETLELNKYKVGSKIILDFKVINGTAYFLSDNGRVSLFDMDSKSLKGTINAKATHFAVQSETNMLLTASGSNLKQWDLMTLKERQSTTFKKNITSLNIEPIEEYAIVGFEDKNIEIISLLSFKPADKKIKLSGIPTTITYANHSKELIIMDANGIASIDFNISMNIGAFNLRQMLNTCEQYNDIQNQIDGVLILELNQKVTKVIRKLITNELDSLSLDEIKSAQNCAKQAYNIGKDQVLDPERLEINQLILEVYEVLKNGDQTRYMNALEKLDRVLELDPDGSYAYNVAAELYLQLNDVNKAKEALNKAEEKAPNWSTPKLKNGEILVAEKKYDEAVAKIQQVIDLDDENANAFVDMAEVQLILGNSEKTEESILKAKEINKAVPMSDTLQSIYNSVAGIPTKSGNNNVNSDQQKSKNQNSNADLNTTSTYNSGNNLDGIIYEEGNEDLLDGLQIGDFYQGGTVFYIDATGKHGLVAAYQPKYIASTWDQAMNFSLSLELNGFSDWRVPTLNEMRTFGLSPVFAPVSVFWTSIKYHETPGMVFWYDTSQNRADYTFKENKRFVIPIRSF